MDYGERIAERAIGSVYRTIHRTYQNASRDLTAKLAEFTKRNQAQEKKKLELLKKGLITEQDFKDWQTGQLFMEKQWKDKIDQCARIMTEANKEAAGVVHGKRLDVFAENYNHAAYQLERSVGNVGFETVNGETVARLIREKPQMLPKWKINEPKDYRWNYRKVENTVKQGIIQGEGVNQIADRLVQSLCTQNEDKMRTFARTAVTGAQNAGRQAQMEEAEELGVQLMKRWVATLDDRTREAHADLDGQEVAVDEPFTVDVDGEHYEIQYPGDPSADPCMVYNCRCTMIQVYKGIDRKSVRRDMDDNEVVNMTYKEWKEAKENGTLNTDKKLVEPPIGREQQPEVSTIVEGKDIVDTWERRPNEFDFAIDDVVNAQGFDGLPQVVSSEEFERMKESAPVYGFRGYSAPDKETLLEYQKQLYSGKWYVDCHVGTAAYGQGMYMQGVLDTSNESGISISKMIAEGYGQSRGNPVYKVEEMLLSPDAKGVSLYLTPGNHTSVDNFTQFMKEYIAENASGKWKDQGVFAAAKGYDYICLDHGNGSQEIIVLNRTKLIIKRGE